MNNFSVRNQKYFSNEIHIISFKYIFGYIYYFKYKFK